MKRSQQQEVERIIHLWFDYETAVEDNEGVCKSGKCLQGEIVTYCGDIPRGSDYKPETVSGRAERLKTITEDQKWAKRVLFSLEVSDRILAVRWVEMKKKVNPFTRQLFTMTEIALSHGMKLETFKQMREIACLELLARAEQTNKKAA